MKVNRSLLLILVSAVLGSTALCARAGIEWCTYLGGSVREAADGIALDQEGNVYVTGVTSSEDFTTSAILSYDATYKGSGDFFVAKLNPSGTRLLYATFLGGASYEWDPAIAADTEGNVYVTGDTWSDDFPVTTGSLQTVFGNVGVYAPDAFIAKLNPSGSELVYSTFIGGRGGDEGCGITIDDDGNVYVAGGTSSPDFPTTPDAYDPYVVEVEGFIAKLNPDGSALEYCTSLGNYYTGCSAIAVDEHGAAYVTGMTLGVEFPVTPGAFDTTYNGGYSLYGDAFVTKVNSTGMDLVYSSFLGGNTFDNGVGIAVDQQGSAYVSGLTSSWDFPVTPGCLKDPRPSISIFATKLNRHGSELAYSCTLEYGGPTVYWTGQALAVDVHGNTYVVGGRNNVSKLNASASAILYCHVWEPSEESGGYTFVHAVCVDTEGNIYVAGETTNPNIATPGAFDTTNEGTDAFVAKIHPDPPAGSEFWQLYQ